MVCDGFWCYVTMTCNYSDVISAKYELGRVQHDVAEGSAQRKFSLFLMSCLLALEVAMMPCSAVFTQQFKCEISHCGDILIHFGSAVTRVKSMSVHRPVWWN